MSLTMTRIISARSGTRWRRRARRTEARMVLPWLDPPTSMSDETYSKMDDGLLRGGVGGG